MRYRRIGGLLYLFFIAAGVFSIALAINQSFNLRLLTGEIILQNKYLYLLTGVLLSLVFLMLPAARRWQERIPLLDYLLAGTTLALTVYLAWNSGRIIREGWEYVAPEQAIWVGLVFWALILEALRRCAGNLLFFIVALVSLYPVVADKVPGPIAGFPRPFEGVVAFHIMSTESAFGIPMQAFGELVLGFIVFGVALQRTGAGAFFNNLALALVGGYRGGAAKVSVIASGFMGSMSGNPVSNVLSTGVVTIPLMKQSGFSSRYAAGVESCASTGGTLLPPVMGATAFVMASFLGVAYYEVAIAATIPALLYFLALFVQIDAYAAKRGMRALDRTALPGLGQTLRGGWHYLLVMVVLVAFMIGLRQERLAPFYATVALLAINQLFPNNRLSLRAFLELLFGASKALAELAGLLCGVGLILGAFSMTGLAGTLANDLVYLAGEAPFMLLLMGAATSFVFGMGMTITACYIFLAVVLAPALVQHGFDITAVHFFILYWAMISWITPPVALASFAAATIAQVNAMAAGFQAMRLGAVIYFLPFFMVFNPALLGKAEPVAIALVCLTSVIGIWMLSSALEGYFLGLGDLGQGVRSWLARTGLSLGGLCFVAPGFPIWGVNALELAAIGVVLALPAACLARLETRRANSVAVVDRSSKTNRYCAGRATRI